MFNFTSIMLSNKCRPTTSEGSILLGSGTSTTLSQLVVACHLHSRVCARMCLNVRAHKSRCACMCVFGNVRWFMVGVHECDVYVSIGRKLTTILEYYANT